MKKYAPQFYYIKHFMDSPPIGQFNVFSLFEFMYLYIYPTYIEAPLSDRYHFKHRNTMVSKRQILSSRGSCLLKMRQKQIPILVFTKRSHFSVSLVLSK